MRTVSMGVLHIAIPSLGAPHRPFPLPQTPRTSAARTRPVAPQASVTPPSVGTEGTLLTSHRSEPAPLERTPEQDAAQEILARLVRQCMAGDQHAWQQLVATQHRRIYAICYRFTASACDSEDLTQDVFLKLYKNLASFDTQKGSFQTWITTLARNLLVDHFRRTRLDRASDSLDASYDGDEDGPTMGDRLADTRPSQESSRRRHGAQRSASRKRSNSCLPNSARLLSFGTSKTWTTKRSPKSSAFPRAR